MRKIWIYEAAACACYIVNVFFFFYKMFIHTTALCAVRLRYQRMRAQAGMAAMTAAARPTESSTNAVVVVCTIYFYRIEPFSRSPALQSSRGILFHRRCVPLHACVDYVKEASARATKLEIRSICRFFCVSVLFSVCVNIRISTIT